MTYKTFGTAGNRVDYEVCETCDKPIRGTACTTADDNENESGGIVPEFCECEDGDSLPEISFDQFCNEHDQLLHDPNYKYFSPLVNGYPENSFTLKETQQLKGVTVYVFDGDADEPAVIFDYETVEPCIKRLADFQALDENYGGLYCEYQKSGGKF